MAYNTAFAALADPTRRTVFERLRGGPRTVTEIADGLPVSRPAVSQHLRALEGARLVTASSHGTRRIYRIDRAGLEALRVYLDSFWTDVLDAFRAEAEAVARADARAAQLAALRQRARAKSRRKR